MATTLLVSSLTLGSGEDEHPLRPSPISSSSRRSCFSPSSREAIRRPPRGTTRSGRRRDQMRARPPEVDFKAVGWHPRCRRARRSGRRDQRLLSAASGFRRPRRGEHRLHPTAAPAPARRPREGWDARERRPSWGAAVRARRLERRGGDLPESSDMHSHDQTTLRSTNCCFMKNNLWPRLRQAAGRRPQARCGRPQDGP